MTLYTTGADNGSTDTGRNPGLMPRVADRDSITLCHCRNRSKIQLIIVCRICAGRVHEDEIFFAENFDCMVDLGTCTHSGRENDRFALLANVSEQAVIRK